MKRTFLLILAFFSLMLTACSQTEAAPTATNSPVPPTATFTPIPPTATNTPEPTLTPTPVPYYLENGSLYDLDEATGHYTLVGKGLAAITTTADGIVAMDGDGEAVFTYENEVWVAVEREPEFIPLAVTEEERVALQEFLDNYEMDWDWDSIPRIMKVDADGQDLGPLEYGFRNDDWVNVPDETFPTYTEEFEFISLAIVGVGGQEGHDRLVAMIPSQSGEQVAVMFLDTMISTSGKQAYLYESGEVRVDASPLYYIERQIPGSNDANFVSGVKRYFANGGEAFQSFVTVSYWIARIGDGIKAHWSDIQSILENDSGAAGLLNDHGVSSFADAVPHAILFPDGLSESLGY